MALVRYRVINTPLGTNEGIIIHVGSEITIPSERARRLLDAGNLELASTAPDVVIEEAEPAPILTPVVDPAAADLPTAESSSSTPDAEVPATEATF